MKTLLLICLLVSGSFGLKAQEVLVEHVVGQWRLTDIPKAAGKEVVLVDSVYDGRAFESHTLLNIGGNYPNQLISVFIDKKDYEKFGGDVLKLFLHKKISVQGKLSLYKEKPQVVVTDPKQLNNHLSWKQKVLHVIL